MPDPNDSPPVRPTCTMWENGSRVECLSESVPLFGAKRNSRLMADHATPLKWGVSLRSRSRACPTGCCLVGWVRCPDPSREKGLERGARNGIRPVTHSKKRFTGLRGIPWQGNYFAFGVSMTFSFDTAGAGIRSTEHRVVASVLDAVLDLAVRWD